MTFQHFGQVPYHCGKFRQLVSRHRDMNKCADWKADPRRIDERPIAENHLALFQPVYPFNDRGSRQSDSSSQLRKRDAGIGLKLSQNFAIDRKSVV